MKLIHIAATASTVAALNHSDLSLDNIPLLQANIQKSFANAKQKTTLLKHKAKYFQQKNQKSLSRKLRSIAQKYEQEVATCQFSSSGFWENCKQCVTQGCTSYWEENCENNKNAQGPPGTLTGDYSDVIVSLKEMIELLNDSAGGNYIELVEGWEDGNGVNVKVDCEKYNDNNINSRRKRRSPQPQPQNEVHERQKSYCSLAEVDCTGDGCNSLDLPQTWEIICVTDEEAKYYWSQVSNDNDPNLPISKKTQTSHWKALAKSNVNFDFGSYVENVNGEDKTVVMIDLNALMESQQSDKDNINSNQENQEEEEIIINGKTEITESDSRSDSASIDPINNFIEEEEFDPEEYFDEIEYSDEDDYDTEAGTAEDDLIKYIEEIDGLTEQEKEELKNSILDEGKRDDINSLMESIKNTNGNNNNNINPINDINNINNEDLIIENIENNTQNNKPIQINSNNGQPIIEEDIPCTDDLPENMEEDDLADIELNLPEEIGEALPDFDELRNLTQEQFCEKFYNGECPKDVIVRRSAMLIQALRNKRNLRLKKRNAAKKGKSTYNSDKNQCQMIEKFPQRCFDLNLPCEDCQVQLSEISGCQKYLDVRRQLSGVLVDANAVQQQFTTSIEELDQKLEWFTSLEDSNGDLSVYVQRIYYNNQYDSLTLEIMVYKGNEAQNIVMMADQLENVSMEEFMEAVQNALYRI